VDAITEVLTAAFTDAQTDSELDPTHPPVSTPDTQQSAHSQSPTSTASHPLDQDEQPQQDNENSLLQVPSEPVTRSRSSSGMQRVEESVGEILQMS